MVDFNVWLFILTADGFKNLQAFFVVILIDNFGFTSENLSYLSKYKFIGIIILCCRFRLLDGTIIIEGVKEARKSGDCCMANVSIVIYYRTQIKQHLYCFWRQSIESILEENLGQLLSQSYR